MLLARNLRKQIWQWMKETLDPLIMKKLDFVT